MRNKPNFIIAGAMKSGTTSLFYDLIKHPQIVPPKNNVKELNFFNFWYPKSTFNKGFDWYVDQFEDLNEGQITGEATTSYMFSSSIARCIRDNFPDMKVIFILRNPVDRTYSQYNHTKRKMIETLSFEDAIKAEENRLSLGRGFEKTYFSYLAKSRYSEQIYDWYTTLPNENLLVIQAEEYFNNPKEELQKVFKFLGVNSRFDASPFSHRNETEEKYKNKFDHNLRKRLENYFKPYNQKLYSIIGREFNW